MGDGSWPWNQVHFHQNKNSHVVQRNTHVARKASHITLPALCHEVNRILYGTHTNHYLFNLFIRSTCMKLGLTVKY